ncbi:MAG: hypothetical protein A3G38_04130 [Omnitrophica WOR_2 bacterium RIFCSPLOWO2_12_FULL_51_8]|nr:MAG: hypothetical protein A3G38_04130 [Omnitrophica WOR_2 bacterium RIFCSPLOWO2_12_FULL_51_8]
MRKLILPLFFLTITFLGLSCHPRPRVYIKKLKNNHYQLIVDSKPYIVKGVCYNPIPIGKNYDYDWWSDPAKPWLADGKLMQGMGVNTIRVYQAGSDPQAVRKVVRDLYNLYRIRTIMGSWLGFWEYPCPLYGDRAFREKVKKEVLEMVNLYKDEPGVLFWTLGNENNYSCSGEVNPWSSDEIDKEPDPQKKRVMRFRTYYSFVNELAREIHQADPHHPVALGNGELKGLEFARESAPDVDLIACIIYRGKTFGNLFKSLRFSFDRPVMLAEFGADAFNAYLKKEDQNMQAFFLESQWRQIYGNLAGNPQGAGNCLGGTSFEWLDEWWKHNESSADGWSAHDTESNWQNSSYYFDSKEGTKNMNEEWFGIVSLSPETENGLHKRVPRKAYYVIREFWKNPVLKSKIKK